jgi:hypothetical protein
MIHVNRVNNVKCEHQSLFTKNSKTHPTTLRSIVIREQYIEYKCELCGNTGEWLEEPMSLQLDHINNMDTLPNNEIQNLRWLCPCCHAIQPTTSCNKKKNRPSWNSVDKKSILNAYREFGSIRQALLINGLDQRNSTQSNQITIWINELNWPRRISGGIIPNADSLSEEGKIILEEWAQKGIANIRYFTNENSKKFW